MTRSLVMLMSLWLGGCGLQHRSEWIESVTPIHDGYQVVVQSYAYRLPPPLTDLHSATILSRSLSVEHIDTRGKRSLVQALPLQGEVDVRHSTQNDILVVEWEQVGPHLRHIQKAGSGAWKPVEQSHPIPTTNIEACSSVERLIYSYESKGSLKSWFMAVSDFSGNEKVKHVLNTNPEGTFCADISPTGKLAVACGVYGVLPGIRVLEFQKDGSSKMLGKVEEGIPLALVYCQDASFCLSTFTKDEKAFLRIDSFDATIGSETVEIERALANQIIEGQLAPGATPHTFDLILWPWIQYVEGEPGLGTSFLTYHLNLAGKISVTKVK